MFPNLLIILAAFLIAMALRSYRQRWIRALGALVALVATFLAGYLLSGQLIGCGVGAMLAWLFLPWIEILTSVRNVRLPLERKLKGRFAPNPAQFPQLSEVSHVLEESGFEHIEDTGWAWGSVDQFRRIYLHQDARMEASISLTERNGITFAHLGFTSRGRDGEVYTTWNFPFPHQMKAAPEVHLAPFPRLQSPSELLGKHVQLLKKHEVDEEDLLRPDPDDLAHIIERETRRQIVHNLDRRVIAPAGSGTFRYAWRGWVFLWLESLKAAVV